MAERKKAEICFCHDCFRAKMLQYEFDPVLAECDDGTRNVASWPVMCVRHLDIPPKTIRCIENLPKKLGI